MVWKVKWKRAALAAVAVVSMVGLVVPAGASGALRYPDLRTLAPEELHLGSALVNERHRYIVRFTNVVWNAGEGPFELHGSPHFPLDASFDATQWVYDETAGVEMQPVGSFAFHAAHQHFHFDGFARYELWSKRAYDRAAAGGFASGTPLSVSAKVSSCILDLRRVDPTIGPPARVYQTCTPAMEGLSVGWGDVYDYLLPDQWVDVGERPLADGEYVIRSIADPGNIVYESPGKANAARESQVANSAATPFSIVNGRLAAPAQ